MGRIRCSGKAYSAGPIQGLLRFETSIYVDDAASRVTLIDDNTL